MQPWKAWFPVVKSKKKELTEEELKEQPWFDCESPNGDIRIKKP